MRYPLVLVFFFKILLVSTNAFTMSMSSSNAAAKRVLVTGGNKGIGYAICKKLLEDHADVHVLLGSRDPSRGEQAVQSLQSILPESSKDRVELVIIDTSSDDSVKSASETVSGKYDSLYGIINNAGIGFGNGFTDTINTNYFGPRRVCDSFAPFIIRPEGRIVNIASASGPNFVSRCQDKTLVEKFTSPLSFQDGSVTGDGIDKLDELAKSYDGQTDYGDEAYGVSKALVNAYTALFAKANTDLIVNSCSPGYILTDMTRGMGASNAPEKGTVSPVHLLLNDEMKTLPTGRYYGSDAVRSPMVSSKFGTGFIDVYKWTNLSNFFILALLPRTRRTCIRRSLNLDNGIEEILSCSLDYDVLQSNTINKK